MQKDDVLQHMLKAFQQKRIACIVVFSDFERELGFDCKSDALRLNWAQTKSRLGAHGNQALQGWPNHLFPSFIFLHWTAARDRIPWPKAYLRVSANHGHLVFRFGGNPRRAARLQMPRRRGEGGGMDPVSVPASAESTAGEEGRRYCSAGGARWLPFVRGQPHRPPPPFRFAAVAFSLADRRGTHYNVAACAERPCFSTSWCKLSSTLSA